MFTYSSSKKNKISGFTGFILMVGFFMLPIILAHFSYYYLDIEGSKTNQGQFLEKTYNLTELQLDKHVATDLHLTNADDWHNSRWTILQYIPKNCDQNCQQIIYKLQQVHIALGKNVTRVQRLHLYSVNKTTDITNINQNIYQQFPHITIASTSQSHPLLDATAVYIADPHGNIILSYKVTDLDFDKKILKDTKKLLNTSRIG